MSLQQIHRETKIPLPHLDALEHGVLSVLPHGVYRRNDTRAYARTVGLDPSVALAALERGLEALGLHETSQPESRLRAWFESGTTRLLLVVALVVAAAFALSALRSGSGLEYPDVRSVSVDRGVRSIAEVRPPLPTRPLPSVVILTPKPTAVAPAAPRVTPPVASSSADAADSGQLVVVTVPDGARLTVDGIGWGTTPLTIRHLRFGDRQIRVTKEGYRAAEHVARLDQADPTRTIAIALSPDSGEAPQQ